MNASDILAYYSRPQIQQAIVQAAKDREAVGVYRTDSFGSRPNTLLYPQDVLSQVKHGMVEFHCSIELWENPMTVQQRKGFDLIFDIDSKKMEHGKIAAQILLAVFEEHGIKNYSVKFSGNRGFHVGIPWICIPKQIDFKPTATLFPDIARKVAFYVRSCMEQRLEKNLLAKYSKEELSQITEKPLNKIERAQGINPFQVVDIDPVLISPRHLYRMPYSLNKKAYLVSLPLRKDQLNDFQREDAQAFKVKADVPFLEGGEEGEADLLFAESIDWHTRNKAVQEKKVEPKRQEQQARVSETLFPPCIKAILQGLKDGKKRSLFILINFLRSMKWDWEDIEKALQAWNQKNTPPFREQYLTTLLRYYKNKKATFPPPSCTQEGYYLSMGVCQPDKTCVSRESLKNPINYPFRILSREEFRKKIPKRRRKEQF